jgi:hypothetical protein
MTPKPSAAAFAAALLIAMIPSVALSGGDSVDGRDEDDNGAPFFGEAKDIKGLRPIQSVRVSAAAKDGRVYVTSTDPQGQFRLAGFGKDVNPDDVDVKCAASGYRSVDVIRRKMSSAPEAPVEVECLLERD